jgi:hypothetical protein
LSAGSFVKHLLTEGKNTMFKTDQRIIGAHARENCDNFARVCQFVILTVQQSLFNVEADFEQIDAGDADVTGILFGWKFAAFNSIWTNRERLYQQCEHEYTHAQSERELALAVVDIIASEPGFGLVKAGFVAQLIYGVAGCLDTHNIRKFGLKDSAFAHYKALKTPKGRARKLAKYIDTCEKLGGCEELWNGWCNYVAERQPKAYQDGDHVSRTHLTALNLERK